ncbi:MAG: alpha/beta hydrolase [Myxococcota bacterium]|jgi:pimeloyl-ACP methyl ester carboxylesterase|nr:alpha/beta hydrolase [Myxococcota bacterium]
MPSIETDGATLHYECHGAGPAIALVHGSGGSALSWWQQVPHFARRHRVVSFDHRGFGRSRCAEGALDPNYFAADLGAVLDAAGVERAALVCQSMGGWTGVGFALAQPARCAALVLAGTPGGIATPAIESHSAGLPQRMAARGFLGMALAPDFPQRDPRRAFLYEQIAALNPPTTLPTLLPKLGAMRVAPERLAALAMPALLLVGTEDAFFSIEGLREVAALLPRARLHVFPGVGHSVYFEEPDAFNGMVDAFLKEIPKWGATS